MQSLVARLGFDMEKLGFNSLWTAMSGTVLVVVYMFTTFASASDVKEVKDQISAVEVRLIKADIRDLRSYLAANPNDRRAQEDLDEMVDDLCSLVPNDRECR